MNAFFGFSLQAPWPLFTKQGRIIEESMRHLTLLFLGKQPIVEQRFPLPSFALAPVGLFDQILFLQNPHPTVVAYGAHFLSKQKNILNFYQTLFTWAKTQSYSVDTRPFLPHTTLARAPFIKEEWEQDFAKLPFVITGFHLYQTQGCLQYQPVVSSWFLPPFEEYPHTADIAFLIRAQNFQELYLHAMLALSFKYPAFCSFIQFHPLTDIDQVIQQLNQAITNCDLAIGCPFKAVSYHDLYTEKEGLIYWDMIVDV